jgi:hypothetical protein
VVCPTGGFGDGASFSRDLAGLWSCCTEGQDRTMLASGPDSDLSGPIQLPPGAGYSPWMRIWIWIWTWTTKQRAHCPVPMLLPSIPHHVSWPSVDLAHSPRAACLPAGRGTISSTLRYSLLALHGRVWHKQSHVCSLTRVFQYSYPTEVDLVVR